MRLQSVLWGVSHTLINTVCESKYVRSCIRCITFLMRISMVFMQGRSCLTNLLETLEDITTSLDDGDSTNIIFLDYQKAFHSVPHRRLLSKLNSYMYGYRGKVLMWIESFLIGRTQKVTVRRATSSKADVVKGRYWCLSCLY